MVDDKKSTINIQEIKEYWMEEASEALNVAWHLYEKNDYSYALFFWSSCHREAVKGSSCCQKGRACPVYS